MTKIAVQLLVGRNEEPFLPYAIRSVNWCDYYTVVNTAPGSEWGRVNGEIVQREIPAEKLRYRELHPDENEHFSFAEARNKCLELTEEGDVVLIVDADDVHYPEFEGVVKGLLNAGADSITCFFWHLMVYKDLYQYVQPREIIYTNYSGTHWSKGVHEQLVNVKHAPVTDKYHYMHYGYIKAQADIFRRWKFYSDLEGDFHHYDGQNPDTIVEDRVAVCQPVPVQHPTVVQDFLRSYPESPSGVVRHSPPRTGTHGQDKIGLVLLTVNDAEILPACLGTLLQTEQPPEFRVLALDINSTDNSLEILQQFQKKGLPMDIVGAEEYVSLSEALNYGFDHFRCQEEYEYVGWVHPDMEFIQPTWLRNLHKELQDREDIGKISAANFRDVVPDDVIPGHEQCYILRKDILHKIGLFDEKFIGIGGYEDWDLNRRIMNHAGPAGPYKVMITPRSYVMHHGMQTRSRRDTTSEQQANGHYYYEKWGTWGPPC